MYATQQLQKAQGLSRRKAQRKQMEDFEAYFRSEHGRDATYEEIASQFQRSRTWVANLKRSGAADREAEVAAHFEKPARKGGGR